MTTLNITYNILLVVVVAAAVLAAAMPQLLDNF